jgi:hypothetical protein
MAFKAIIDMVIKKPNRESNLHHPHHRQTCYQLSFHGLLKGASFYDTCEVKVKNMKNKTVYYTEKVECRI